MDTATRPGGMSMPKKAPNKANLNQPQIARPQRVNVGWIRASLCKTNPIPGRRGRDIGGLAMPEAGTQTSLAHRILDLGFWIMPEAGTHAARNGTGRSGNLTTGVHQVPAEEWRVASGGWRRPNGGGRCFFLRTLGSTWSGMSPSRRPPTLVSGDQSV